MRWKQWPCSLDTPDESLWNQEVAECSLTPPLWSCQAALTGGCEGPVVWWDSVVRSTAHWRERLWEGRAREASDRSRTDTGAGAMWTGTSVCPLGLWESQWVFKTGRAEDVNVHLDKDECWAFYTCKVNNFYCVLFGVSAQPGLDTDSLKKLDTWAHTEGGCFSNVPVLQVRIAFLIWTVCSH